MTFDGVTKEITYTANEAKNDVAGKIRTAFTGGTTNYDVGGENENVVFTAKNAGAISTVAYVQ